ncbi:hypothetical protein [Calidithermus chliarophilus]|uniref:hypothetical protein n=1 Tax=Calidithermus chliarophilus TaxID=52023 RepID=UPI0004256F49|nr:hypothetical protein [Calidithermus chliarophilus]
MSAQRFTTIRRSRPERDFFLMRNSVAQDKSLTPEALGVLVYLLSQPCDWRVKLEDITGFRATGRDRAYRILRELLEARYIVRETLRAEGGQIVGVEYVVYDERQPVTENQEEVTETLLPEKPDTAKPHTANPDTAEPDTANPDAYKDRVKQSTKITKTDDDGVARAREEKPEVTPPPPAGRAGEGSEPPPQAQEPPADPFKSSPATRDEFHLLRELEALGLTREGNPMSQWAWHCHGTGMSRATRQQLMSDFAALTRRHGLAAVAEAVRDTIRAGSKSWRYLLRVLEGQGQPQPQAQPRRPQPGRAHDMSPEAYERESL